MGAQRTAGPAGVAVLALLVLLVAGACGADLPRPDTAPTEAPRRAGTASSSPTSAASATAGPTSSTGAPGAPAPSGSPSPPTADVAAARAALATLPVVERWPAGLASYDRDAFGESWADTDGNGCNQRDDVLLRDVLPGTVEVQQQDSCDHDVLAGSWLDPYTGAVLTFDDLKDQAQAQAIQIDHVVPLAEAWRSGAAGWGPERLEAYANDLDGLLAVDGPTNAAKGDDDPAAWRPRQDFQCAYGVRWVLAKARWGLGADASEARALRELLGLCP